MDDMEETILELSDAEAEALMALDNASFWAAVLASTTAG